MSILIVKCNFIGHSYQGVRITHLQREEIDWPPSPARIHQALLSAALTGVSSNRQDEFAQRALKTLRWLETQIPEIVASKISSDKEAGTRLSLAIPQNNPARNDFTRTSILLAPSRRIRMGISGNPLKAYYIWRLNGDEARDIQEEYLPALTDVAAQVRYLGRAEDQVEIMVELQESEELSQVPRGCETWRRVDHAAEIQLWRPRPRTTDALLAEHVRVVPSRTRKSPTTRFFQAQDYSRCFPRSIQPVQTSIFQLIPETDNPDEPPLSCDPENAGIWRSRIRQRAIEIAKENGRWDHPELANELITGHPSENQKRSDMPHLAFAPVPSMSLDGKADGRVRRIALLGYAPLELEEMATDVYRILFSSLDGERLSLDGHSYCTMHYSSSSATSDRVWRQYIRASSVWLSVLPVALARHFEVPTHSPDGSRKLLGNERHQRKLEEWSRLLRSSLKHVGLPSDVSDSCSCYFTPSPLIPKTERAERYRPPGESAVFTHARLEFAEPVTGPLLIGDRRYQGFGLLMPSN